MPLRIRTKPYSSLKAWRLSHGFSQHEAARFLEISQSYYHKLETHQQSPRRNMARKLTQTTGVPLDELMGIAS
jgi:transcriptional regulator with XRE-family HTH domain